MNFPNIIGVIGAFFILIAYILLLVKKISADDWNYSFFNFLGGCMIIYSLTYAWNMPAFLIEVLWVIISFCGMVRWGYQNFLKKTEPSPALIEKDK